LNLKENMQALKEELNSEEKFFESAVRTERFVKKYQKPMIALGMVALLGIGGSMVYQMVRDAKKERANEALTTLLMHPNDSKALEELLANDASLYELYTLSHAMRTKDIKALETLRHANSAEISDIASYERAVIAKDTKALETYGKTQGGIYQELALVDVAVLAIQKGDVQAAHTALNGVKEDSAVYPLARMLNHYGVK